MLKDPSKNSSLSPNEERSVKIGEASKILGLHIDTLRRWEKSGKITPIRTPGGTRLYSLTELNNLVPKVSENFSKPSAKKLPTKNLHEKNKEDIYAHIYNKGVEARVIFNDGEDFKVFQGFLEDYLTAPKDPKIVKKAFQVHGRIFQGTPHQPKNYFNKIELIAYSLMPDHFHLLLHQVIEGSLESFIRSLCTRYSMYFNKKYKHTGALFEGPYKSVQIKDEPSLLQLTRYLHQNSDYSSYPDYLGERETSWVKPKKGTGDYKDFVEKFEFDQEEKELLEGITFEAAETAHLKGRDLARNEEIYLDPGLKPLQRIPELLGTAVVFSLLLGIGITNIQISRTKSPNPFILGITNIMVSTTKSPSPSPTPADAVIPAPADAALPAGRQVKPKILTVKIDDGGEKVNIRQKPTTDSIKIGEAKDGDTFEFVSHDSGWYEVKLAAGSTGFISATYIKEGETNN